ncbi:orotate phosphoribosyltransferase [Methanoregula sp.]|uniref:orotate phosphoribosyltransferase n=1 Tax=Methanoregula sp. TaxID=2052170 RepID=UPI002CD18528|nr:orotate phosphoribosyltransferase [Methanoregula sp.]HVP96321.1 orotate phosphoribosyltransferase [Methanoregula sp.]
MNAIADLLIRYKAIEFGDFTLASGAKSRYYVDVKTAVTHPEFLEAIAREIAKRYEFDVVAGVAVGGVPLAVATALAAQKPFAIIRADEKDHGKKNPIIGEVKGKTILLVEDVTTSGGSALYGITMLRNAGARADRVVTVVDREQGAAAALRAQAIDLFSLVRVSEIL